MRYVLPAVLVLVMAVGLLTPASAQYNYNWSDNFDWAPTHGCTLAGNNGWVTPSGCTSPMIQGYDKPSYSPHHSILQTPGVRSAIKKDIRNTLHLRYLAVGIARFWIYDPYPTNSAGNLLTYKVDTRAGVYSLAPDDRDLGVDNGAMTYALGAGITDTRGAYWTAYASSGFIQMDGAATNTASAYTLSAAGCAPAPRKAGWNSLIISWEFDWDTKSMHANFYVNLDYRNPQVNAVLDCNGNATGTLRYNNLRWIAGLFIGSGSSFSMQAPVDDVSITGDGAPLTIPEPSSMLALGSGVAALCVMLRRRR